MLNSMDVNNLTICVTAVVGVLFGAVLMSLTICPHNKHNNVIHAVGSCVFTIVWLFILLQQIYMYVCFYIQ